MRHQYANKKLGRATDQRLAMLKSLSVALFKYKRIETTLTRAKELKKMAERIVTLVKKGDLASRRRVISMLLHDKELVKAIFKNAESFKTRAGGYCRIIQTTLRRGDAAKMALIELV